MKKFSQYLSEDIIPLAQYQPDAVGIDNGPARDNINSHLANVTAAPFQTPYHALQAVRRILSAYNISLPAVTFLDGEEGHEVFIINQFGTKMGMTNDGNMVVAPDSPYHVYFEWSESDNGRFDIYCEIVDEAELEELLSDIEDEEEEEEELDEQAKWRTTKVAKKVTSPNRLDSVSVDYHYSEPRSTGMLKAKSDKTNSDGSISNRHGSDVATRGDRKGKITKASGSRLASDIVANHYAKNKKAKLPEEAQLDELSHGTLGSYVTKASHDVATKSAAVGRYSDRANRVRDELKKGDYSNAAQGKKDDEFAEKMFKKSWKRRQGIAKAVDKLTREEALDELSKNEKWAYNQARSRSLMKDKGNPNPSSNEKENKSFEKGLKHYKKEKIDEITTKLARNYIQKNSDQRWKDKKMTIGTAEKRLAGSTLAKRKLLGIARVATTEETLDELHGKGSLEGIRDFHKKKAAELGQRANKVDDTVRDRRGKTKSTVTVHHNDGKKTVIPGHGEAELTSVERNRNALQSKRDLASANVKRATGLIKKRKSLKEDQLDEVSQKAATSAYASANDPDYYHPKADNILGHIKRKFGDKAENDAESHAYTSHFGRNDHDRPGKDSLSGGLRSGLSDKLTKAGKIPSGTQTGMKNKMDPNKWQGYGRKVGGPKGHLPEEALDEISHGLAKKAENKSFKQYYRAYDDEAKAREEHIQNKTPETKAGSDAAREKRLKIMKRTASIQKYADKKKPVKEDYDPKKKKEAEDADWSSKKLKPQTSGAAKYFKNHSKKLKKQAVTGMDEDNKNDVPWDTKPGDDKSSTPYKNPHSKSKQLARAAMKRQRDALVADAKMGAVATKRAMKKASEKKKLDEVSAGLAKRASDKADVAANSAWYPNPSDKTKSYIKKKEKQSIKFANYMDKKK